MELLLLFTIIRSQLQGEVDFHRPIERNRYPMSFFFNEWKKFLHYFKKNFIDINLCFSVSETVQSSTEEARKQYGNMKQRGKVNIIFFIQLVDVSIIR